MRHATTRRSRAPHHRTQSNATFLRKKAHRYLRPTSVRMWHKVFLRWVLLQGRSPHASGSSKNALDPSALPFSGHFRRRAINPSPPKRVKAWGDGPLRPEVLYPVVEHTRMNRMARNHSRPGAPHHRTQCNATFI